MALCSVRRSISPHSTRRKCTPEFVRPSPQWRCIIRTAQCFQCACVLIEEYCVAQWVCCLSINTFKDRVHRREIVLRSHEILPVKVHATKFNLSQIDRTVYALVELQCLLQPAFRFLPVTNYARGAAVLVVQNRHLPLRCTSNLRVWDRSREIRSSHPPITSIAGSPCSLRVTHGRMTIHGISAARQRTDQHYTYDGCSQAFCSPTRPWKKSGG